MQKVAEFIVNLVQPPLEGVFVLPKITNQTHYVSLVVQLAISPLVNKQWAA